MDLRKELRGRKWPAMPTDAKFSFNFFVREGRIFSRSLLMHQDISEPLPPGECAITSLATAPDGKVHGATSGARAHLFCYTGEGQIDGVTDLGPIPGARAVRRSLVVDSEGTVLGGISEVADGMKEGRLFRCPKRNLPPPPTTEERRRRNAYNTPRTLEIELLSAPVAGECIAAMTMDRERGLAYGISGRSATLFSTDMAGKVSVKGRTTEDRNYSHCLVLDRRGNVYGAGPLGQLFRFDPETNEIQTLPLSLPTVAGREFYNRLDSAALDPASGLIYGGGSADGVIFVFDPREMTIRSLGKVTAEPRCRAITVGVDGRVYGMAGEPDGMGHLFCYDPEAHELRDLGTPATASERVWHGYEFDAACTGPNGEIYLGESDRISHLFIYFPPIRPARPAPAE